MPLAAGTRLGNYEIISPLGTGGMGEVCRAKDLRLDREVSLEVLSSEMSAPSLGRWWRLVVAVATLAGLSSVGAAFALPGPQGTQAQAGCQSPPVGLDIGPSREALVGNPLILNLTGTLDAPATITWRKNGVPTGWPSQAGHAIPNPQLSDAGNYDCIVCNSCGCDTSNVAHIAMYAASQPTSVTAAVACTTVTVTWPPVSGATGYVVSDHSFFGQNYVMVAGPPFVQTAHIGVPVSYSVRTVVRDSLYAYDPAMGRMSNPVATDFAPQIDRDPVGAGLEEGERLLLFVQSPTFGPNTVYTWRRNGVAVASGPFPDYTHYVVEATTLADAGTYDVVISNTCGTVTSAPAVVTICRTPIVDIPSAARDVRANLNFPTVGIGGTVQKADSIRWFRAGVLLGDGSHYSGTTSGVLVIHGQSSADNGYYQLKAYGSCQIIEGPVIRLAVSECVSDPSITSQPPATASATYGNPVTISVAASGCAPGYQWFHHDNRWGTSDYSDRTWETLGGATQSSLTVFVNQNTVGDYRCRVFSGWSSVTSTMCNVGQIPDFHFTYVNAVAKCGEIDVSWDANEPASVTPYVWPGPCGVGTPRILGTSSLASAGYFVIQDPNGSARALSLSAVGADNSFLQSACVPISGASFGSHVYAGITVLPYYAQTANGPAVPILVSVGNDGCSVFAGTISLTAFVVDNVAASLLDSNLAPVIPAPLVPASMNAGTSRQFPTYLLPVTPPGPNVIQLHQLLISITITPFSGTPTTLTAMARLGLTSAGPN